MVKDTVQPPPRPPIRPSTIIGLLKQSSWGRIDVDPVVSSKQMKKKGFVDAYHDCDTPTGPFYGQRRVLCPILEHDNCLVFFGVCPKCKKVFWGTKRDES